MHLIEDSKCDSSFGVRGVKVERKLFQMQRKPPRSLNNAWRRLTRQGGLQISEMVERILNVPLASFTNDFATQE